MSRLGKTIGTALARWLGARAHIHGVPLATDPEQLKATLQPGDVLLVEGQARISVAIKYLTQSTWSHAALYLGPAAVGAQDAARPFIEADVAAGVRLVGFDEFAGLHCRICRPVDLAAADRSRLIAYALAQRGRQYDLQNVFDLARYLIPTPPVPPGWRRRMLALGSGDPTRAICSTLVAQCFQEIRYPILPLIDSRPAARMDCPDCMEEVLRIRHHSLFVPRDFDVSPYFRVVKPTIERGFDYRRLTWAEDPARPSTTTAPENMAAAAKAAA